jgi:hypothetical protein
MIAIKVSKSILRMMPLESQRPQLPVFPLMKQKFTAPGVPCYGTVTPAEQWGKGNGK